MKLHIKLKIVIRKLCFKIPGVYFTFAITCYLSQKRNIIYISILFQMPEQLVILFNHVISHMTKVLASETLKDQSWPVAEFFSTKSPTLCKLMNILFACVSFCHRFFFYLFSLISWSFTLVTLSLVTNLILVCTVSPVFLN